MTKINFTQQGSGPNIILLHGFPFNHTIWNDFALPLAKEFTVITPDLPGLGSSEILPLPFSIEAVADSLLSWLTINKITNSILIGHSLGGYVGLAMIEKSPALFTGFVLFHSSAYADTVEKKDSRNKVLNFVNEQGVFAFTSNFIPPLFKLKDHEAIAKVRSISIQASADAVTGYTMAMRDRPDRTHVVKHFNKPILFIGGTHDAGISIDSISKQAQLAKQGHLNILDDVAHMGMFEKPEEVINILNSFIKNNI